MITIHEEPFKRPCWLFCIWKRPVVWEQDGIFYRTCPLCGMTFEVVINMGPFYVYYNDHLYDYDFVGYVDPVEFNKDRWIN